MYSGNRERGAVLLVSLLILLLVTIVGFATMETSNLEVKMSTAREMKEISFQTAESILEEAASDYDYLGSAYTAFLRDPNDPQWPAKTDHSLNGYDSGYRELDAGGESKMKYITNTSTAGYSIRKGAAGVDTYYYEVEATSELSNENISNTHVQGVYVEAPRVN
jgi:type IV pilus assembly protein PilX